MDRNFSTTSSISSRKNSYGSCHSIPASSASSNQNSDDDDSDTTTSLAVSYRERRREAHTQAEQKRRDAIRRGYDELQGLVCPPINDPMGLKQTKVSKATILQKSISQIEKLLKQTENQKSELDRLNKEVVALKIMKANYEHILKANQSAGQVNESQLPDELKYQVFQQMMDQLFLSFNAYTSTNTFAELSACVIRWLEEHCKPQCLRELMHKTISVALTQYQQQCDQQRKSAATVAQQQMAGVDISTSTQSATSALQSSLISATRIANSNSETSRAALVQHLPQLVHHLTTASEMNRSQGTAGQSRSQDPNLHPQTQQQPRLQSQQTSQTVLGPVVGSSNLSLSSNPFTV